MKTPIKLQRQAIYEEHAKITGKKLLAHEGYFRENNGDWIITDAAGERVAAVSFKGKAKRGETWNAPDPEGQANAELIVAAVNEYAARHASKP